MNHTEHYYCILSHCLAGRPCVDCHAFEFMQRALQDLKKTAFKLDAQVTVPIPLCFSYTLCCIVIILVSTV